MEDLDKSVHDKTICFNMLKKEVRHFGITPGFELIVLI